MTTLLIKSKLSRSFIPLLLIIFFSACHKDLGNTDTDNGTIPDLVTTVNSSVSGFVSDENNTAVINADVKAGGISTTTDKYGFFEIKNAAVIKSAAVVTVTKPGYFNGIKTYIAADNKDAFFRIKLLPKTITGTISATAGGSVTLSNGLTVALPVDGVVMASGGATYTGTIKVAIKYLDPTAADLNQIMPGDLRGLNTSGEIKGLQSFGMTAVELTTTSGELLQIASGKKATITMPIPSAIAGTAPSTIPLWYFDEAKGLWKEDGAATKSGNTYVGEVSHFSFWNYDIPGNYVQFDCTVNDATGNPIPNVVVKIAIVGGGPNSAHYDFTNGSGYVSGIVPDNAQLLMEVYPNINCNNPAYSQNFTTNNTNISLGTIVVSQGAATLSGTVTNCNNMPVTNGYILMSALNGFNTRVALSNTGSYNFSTILCIGSSSATLVAEDVTTLQQSTPVIRTLVPGANAIGNLQACGLSILQFAVYTIDGGAPIQFSYPTDSVRLTTQQGPVSIQMLMDAVSPNSPTGDHLTMAFDGNNISVGSLLELSMFTSSRIGTLNNLSPIFITVTEYGAVGEFIAGNFTAPMIDPSPGVNTIYNITCSFRLRRDF